MSRDTLIKILTALFFLFLPSFILMTPGGDSLPYTNHIYVYSLTYLAEIVLLLVLIRKASLREFAQEFFDKHLPDQLNILLIKVFFLILLGASLLITLPREVYIEVIYGLWVIDLIVIAALITKYYRRGYVPPGPALQILNLDLRNPDFEFKIIYHRVPPKIMLGENLEEHYKSITSQLKTDFLSAVNKHMNLGRLTAFVKEQASQYGVAITSVDVVSGTVEKEPPTKDATNIGFDSKGREVLLPDRLRERDLYIIGGKRTGKSTLVLAMMHQDIMNDKGFTFIDPHGDFAEQIIKYPNRRSADTIYFHPAKIPVPIELFDARDPVQQRSVAKNVAKMFERSTEGVGAVMRTIVEHGFITIAKGPNPKFTDLYKMLTSPLYLAEKVKEANDPDLTSFWGDVYREMDKKSKNAVIHRLASFNQSPLKDVFGVANPPLRIADVMNERKIFVANLSGLSGDEDLVGAMLISLIQLEIMRRVDTLDKSKRVPHYLYIDEFQNFIGDGQALEKLLSECGKYGVHLTLIHQYFAQAHNMAKAITGNVDTAIIFRTDPNEAHHLKKYLGDFTSDDITALNFEERQTICHMDGQTFYLYAIDKFPKVVNDQSEVIKQATVSKYLPTHIPQAPPTAPDDEVKNRD